MTTQTNDELIREAKYIYVWVAGTEFAAKTTKADALALSRAYDELEITADGDSVYIAGGHRA